MTQHEPQQRSRLNPVLAGGSMLAALFLLIDLQDVVKTKNPGRECQQVVQAKAAISRQQLAKLLTIPERDKKQKVRAILKEPYCELPSLEIRAGATAEREAYPLEFDPQTWVVILYEGNEYAGYQLSSH
ncbi:hypothetical protein BST81_07960 [Leptolyngbya sp. 'hensonii']|uniref:hypothetical protein n=1 Tax=Leptolyngbya sp. 'hensonii' TaxID=1922337 RepID=UPI0009501B40|nr:hypothetical protein [Leptolyngbya sp. 'hensonii']OLP18844.1 hypothetical protein BST81_07960 [Leptolyngbya sp. 'hensonii']